MRYETPISRFLEVNGLRLHYLDWGGEGPPAVFHHGTGFHAWTWAPVVRALGGRRHVYALDARGHGDSDKPAAGYRWEVLIADLIGFLDELGVRGALGVGHSLGGATMAGAAAERPELFERLVLVDPIVYPREQRSDASAEHPIVVAARKRRERWASPGEVLDSYRGRGPFATWREEALRLYVENGFTADDAGGVRLKCPRDVEVQVFSMEPSFDSWGALERVRCPALVLRGAESPVLSAHDLEEIARRLPRGEVRALAGTTHFVPMEDPEAVAAAIAEFDAPEGRLPIANRGLRHLALSVVELEACVRFYEEVFGMTVVWRPDADNVYLSGGADNLALHRASGPRAPSGSPLDHLGFLVSSAEDVFAAARALEAKGLPLRHPPRHHRDGSCSLYLDDPDGNVVQVLYEPNASRA